MKIKVIDRKGTQIEIEKSLWDNLSKLKNCQFRLADVPVPQEVIEFKPTQKAIEKNAVTDFIRQKECCKQECEKKVYEVEPEVLQNTDETISVYEPKKQDKPKRTTKRKAKE